MHIYKILRETTYFESRFHKNTTTEKKLKGENYRLVYLFTVCTIVQKIVKYVFLCLFTPTLGLHGKKLKLYAIFFLVIHNVLNTNAAVNVCQQICKMKTDNEQAHR